MRAGITDGTGRGTAILLFFFMHVVFRSRMSILPLFATLPVPKQEADWGDLVWLPKPIAKVQVSQDRELVRKGFSA